MLLLVVIILAILLVTMTSYEHMTNKDLMSTLKTYGTPDQPKKKKSADNKAEAPIYGPKVAPVEHPAPSEAPSGKNGSGGSYPDIYGPEVVAEPGGLKPAKRGKHESDNVEDETYDYNPDLQKAFPTSGPPQPFLADFSKFQS